MATAPTATSAPAPSPTPPDDKFVPFHAKLKPAQFAGVTFFTTGGRLRFGRRNAMHEYPYRDVVWIEDLGRAARRIQMIGFLLGDDVLAQRDKLQAASESPNGGELQHPTLGRRTVALLEAETGESYDAGRMIEVVLTFVEQGARQYPASTQANSTQTKASADAADTANASSFAKTAAPALTGPASTSALTRVANAFGIGSTFSGHNATALVSMTAVMASSAGNLIRNGTGILLGAVVLNAPADIQSLIALAAVGRQKIATANAKLTATAGTATKTNTADFTAAAVGVTEALRTAAATPGDGVRALTPLAIFTPTATESGDALTVELAASALLRRSAIVSLVRAASDYQCQSSDEAIALRNTILELINLEIDAAGDSGDDAAYASLRTLRADILSQLNAEGTALPGLVQVDLDDSVPSLVLAYRLYRDPSRADELVARAGAIHPAFMPRQFKALSA